MYHSRLTRKLRQRLRRPRGLIRVDPGSAVRPDPYDQSFSRNSALNKGRPAKAVYNAYAVSASTLPIAKRELPAYHAEKSAAKRKAPRVRRTMIPDINANIPNRIRANTASAAMSTSKNT